MKHIKQYESIKEVPQIGDYAICKNDDFPTSPIVNFIGQIIDIRETELYKYEIRYPTHSGHAIGDAETYFKKSEILYHSPIKADLEIYLSAQKYNL